MEPANTYGPNRPTVDYKDLRFKLNQTDTQQNDLRYLINIKKPHKDLRSIINQNLYKSDLRKMINIKRQIPDLRNIILNKKKCVNTSNTTLATLPC